MIDKPRNMPPPGQRLTEADGTMNKFWREYFEDMDRATRKVIEAVNDHETRIEDLEP